MLFYCPNCRKEYEIEPSGTITTKGGRTAYKATCPVCGLDLTEFTAQSPRTPTTPPTPAPGPVNPDASAAQTQVETVDTATAAETIKAYFQPVEEDAQNSVTPQEVKPAEPTPSSPNPPPVMELNEVTTPTTIEEFPIETHA